MDIKVNIIEDKEMKPDKWRITNSTWFPLLKIDDSLWRYNLTALETADYTFWEKVKLKYIYWKYKLKDWIAMKKKKPKKPKY